MKHCMDCLFFDQIDEQNGVCFYQTTDEEPKFVNEHNPECNSFVDVDDPEID